MESDSTFQFDSDSDPTYNFDADLNRAPYQSVHATIDLQTVHGSILSLNASIVSFHGPPWLHCEPSQLLNFNLDADPDPAFDFDADLAFTLMRILLPKVIRIRNTGCRHLSRTAVKMVSF